MTEEEAKREIVAGLRELHVILTQGPTRKYRTGLLAAHPQLPKLKEKIARALNPHKATLDPFPREFEMFLRHIFYSVREVPADPVSVLQLEHQMRRFGGKPPSPVKPKKGATFDPKSGTLTLNGKPLSLTAGEKYVLKILVEKRATSFTKLQAAHARPDRVLKALQEKYPGLKKFISRPGGPGRGGYSTTIELTDTD